MAKGLIDYDCPELQTLNKSAHNAIADARWQAWVVWMAFQALGLLKRIYED
jgi:hypothetical protein